MKTIFSALFVLAMSVPAFANMTGTWTGEGKIKNFYGVVNHCDEIMFEYHQSQVVLSMKYGHVFCGMNQSNLQPFALRIDETDLLHNGYQIGTLEDDVMHLDYISNGYRTIIDTKIVDGKMLYRQQSINYYGQRVWALEGELSKQ